MKSIISWLLCFILLAACKNSPKKDTVTITSDDGKTTTTVDMSGVTSAMEDMQEKVEKLQKLPALTTDQLKGFLPEELGGMKRTKFSANSMMGYGTAEATYSGDDGKRVELEIFDCAGPAGAGFGCEGRRSHQGFMRLCRFPSE